MKPIDLEGQLYKDMAEVRKRLEVAEANLKTLQKTTAQEDFSALRKEFEYLDGKIDELEPQLRWTKAQLSSQKMSIDLISMTDYIMDAYDTGHIKRATADECVYKLRKAQNHFQTQVNLVPDPWRLTSEFWEEAKKIMTEYGRDDFFRRV